MCGLHKHFRYAPAEYSDDAVHNNALVEADMSTNCAASAWAQSTSSSSASSDPSAPIGPESAYAGREIRVTMYLEAMALPIGGWAHCPDWINAILKSIAMAHEHPTNTQKKHASIYAVRRQWVRQSERLPAAICNWAGSLAGRELFMLHDGGGGVIRA